MVLVRPLRREDLPAVQALNAAAFPNPWSARSLEERFGDDMATFLVAESDGRLAGFVLAFTVLGEMDLQLLAVAGGERRKGIGRMLVQALIDSAARQGTTVIHLEVRRGNDAARSLYAAAGFEEVGLRRDYYRDPFEDAVLYRRELV